jgi:cysteine desulfurase family protein (TIGR01976 family)
LVLEYLWSHRKGGSAIRDLSSCRSQFPSLELTVAGEPAAFLDAPGGTQVPAQVVLALARHYLEGTSNTGGAFLTSERVDELVARARRRLAEFLGAPAQGSVAFGANMTTLAFALSRALGRVLSPGDEVVVTELDHDANVAPWRALAERGAVVRTVPMTEDGQLDMAALEQVICARTRVVAVGWASNALGTVTDLAPVRAWTRAVGALMVVDAVHAAPHLPMDVAALDPDFLFCSVYKFFGPHVGVLYARPGALEALPTDRVAPQRERGPERVETGTLNHAALAGAVAAVDFVEGLAEEGSTPRERLRRAMEDVYAYEHALAAELFDLISSLPGVRVYGPRPGKAPRAPTIAFTVAGLTAREVASALGRRGIFVWDGDFYAPGVVRRLGLEARGGLVRAGLAPYNTRAEVVRAAAAVAALARA